MKKYIPSTFCTLMLAFSLFVAHGQTATSAVPAVPSGGAIVLDLGGTIEVKDPSGRSITASRDTVLLEGTTIDTRQNGTMVLRLDEGSEILVQAHSQLTLKRSYLPAGTTLFDLLIGKLRAVVTKRSTGSPSFELGTPSAVVAVRGTQFDVLVNFRQVTEVDVQQGIVEVRSRRNPAASVRVEAGFSTRVGLNMVPEAPVPTETMRPEAQEQHDRESSKEQQDEHTDETDSSGSSSSHEEQGPDQPEKPPQKRLHNP